ncbi:MAG: acyl-protein synthetase, partial [Polyangiaceae bacterium]
MFDVSSVGLASSALHVRARAVIHAFERREPSPEPFDALAIDLARFQALHVPGYGRLCAARGVDLHRLTRATEAPAVPTDAFKLASVFAFPYADAAARFLTSGTTIGARGTHAMRDIATYEAAARAFGRVMLAVESRAGASVLVVGPSAREAPDSSLAHMCSLFVRSFDGTDDGGGSFFVRNGELDVDGLRARILSLQPTRPAVVLATSFALVHLVDALGDELLPLPLASRVMQTGGYKGKSREVAPEALRRSVARAFCVDERAVVGEYGMTEISSQFWEATAADRSAAPGVYREPPWARVVAVDATSLEPLPDGSVGIARIEDLANVDSAWAVLTRDRVRRVAGGFEVLGRAP